MTADAHAAGIRALADRLRAARRVAVLTGAGVSAASGVPTFRGPDGLWRQYRPEDLATPAAFERDPRLVWEWYDWRRTRIAGCTPNAAHAVLAAWGARWPAFTLVTQNVDDLHERAGSAGVLHLHGSIWHVRCAARCRSGRASRRRDDAPLASLPPRCPACGAVERPDVVWFGEPLDPRLLERAADAVDGADVVLVVGTSAVVHPAAGLIGVAAAARAFVAEVNPRETPWSADVDLALRAAAEDVLPAVDAALGPPA
jgi:NAD-dependent deacetylase